MICFRVSFIFSLQCAYLNVCIMHSVHTLYVDSSHSVKNGSLKLYIDTEITLCRKTILLPGLLDIFMYYYYIIYYLLEILHKFMLHNTFSQISHNRKAHYVRTTSLKWFCYCGSQHVLTIYLLQLHVSTLAHSFTLLHNH